MVMIDSAPVSILFKKQILFYPAWRSLPIHRVLTMVEPKNCARFPIYAFVIFIF